MAKPSRAADDFIYTVGLYVKEYLPENATGTQPSRRIAHANTVLEHKSLREKYTRELVAMFGRLKESERDVPALTQFAQKTWFDAWGDDFNPEHVKTLIDDAIRLSITPGAPTSVLVSVDRSVPVEPAQRYYGRDGHFDSLFYCG